MLQSAGGRCTLNAVHCGAMQKGSLEMQRGTPEMPNAIPETQKGILEKRQCKSEMQNALRKCKPARCKCSTCYETVQFSWDIAQRSDASFTRWY